MAPRTSAAQMTRQAGRRKVKTFRLGDRHNGTGIGSRIHLQFEGGIGLNLGKKCGELCFGHAGCSCYKKTLGIFLQPGGKIRFRFSMASGSAGPASTSTTGRQRSSPQTDLSTFRGVVSKAEVQR
jgi:hypothetical protein